MDRDDSYGKIKRKMRDKRKKKNMWGPANISKTKLKFAKSFVEKSTLKQNNLDLSRQLGEFRIKLAKSEENHINLIEENYKLLKNFNTLKSEYSSNLTKLSQMRNLIKKITSQFLQSVELINEADQLCEEPIKRSSSLFSSAIEHPLVTAKKRSRSRDGSLAELEHSQSDVIDELKLEQELKSCSFSFLYNDTAEISKKKPKNKPTHDLTILSEETTVIIPDDKQMPPEKFPEEFDKENNVKKRRSSSSSSSSSSGSDRRFSSKIPLAASSSANAHHPPTELKNISPVLSTVDIGAPVGIGARRKTKFEKVKKDKRNFSKNRKGRQGEAAAPKRIKKDPGKVSKERGPMSVYDISASETMMSSFSEQKPVGNENKLGKSSKGKNRAKPGVKDGGAAAAAAQSSFSIMLHAERSVEVEPENLGGTGESVVANPNREKPVKMWIGMDPSTQVAVSTSTAGNGSTTEPEKNGNTSLMDMELTLGYNSENADSKEDTTPSESFIADELPPPLIGDQVEEGGADGFISGESFDFSFPQTQTPTGPDSAKRLTFCIPPRPPKDEILELASSTIPDDTGNSEIATGAEASKLVKKKKVSQKSDLQIKKKNMNEIEYLHHDLDNVSIEDKLADVHKEEPAPVKTRSLRQRATAISYREPKLNSKLRRGNDGNFINTNY